MSYAKAKQNHEQKPHDGEPDRSLMCTAHGCPNRWSSSSGHLCRWHANAEPDDWPMITQQQQWDETDRARKRGDPATYTQPMDFGQRKTLLGKLQRVLETKDPKSWAKLLRHRELSGEKLSPLQKEAWRNALSEPFNTINPQVEP